MVKKINRELNEAQMETVHDDVDHCNQRDMSVCIFLTKIERRNEERGTEKKSRPVRL